MVWPKTTIKINDIEDKANTPFIISSSRTTDIPAFYAKEFIDHIKKGYLLWRNPFNYKKQIISLQEVKFIVFWSKNPSPLVKHLKELDEMGIAYYFNYTLNDYEQEYFEKHLPNLQNRINTFKKLSNRIGQKKIIWRFDPIVVKSDQKIDQIIKRIKNIASELNDYTNKLVFSFIDSTYKKVQYKLKSEAIQIHKFNNNEKIEFAQKLVQDLSIFDFTISSCAENIDLSKYGITPNKCIDDKLILEISKDKVLNEFIQKLRTKNKLNDKGQRKHCQCIVSKDIGKYDTCGFSCIYCYAMKRNSPRLQNNIFE